MIDEIAYINELGVSLRKSREAAGLTKVELAAKLNTTKSVISRIEDSTGSIVDQIRAEICQGSW